MIARSISSRASSPAGSPDARSRAPRRRLGDQRGFTLIELMIALVISSLLVGMIFAIFMRMSIAYRGQQQVAEVQSKIAAARARIEVDAKQAGMGMANGFHMAGMGTEMHRPLRVISPPGEPDQIQLYYGDPSVRAVTLVMGGICDRMQCNKLHSTEGFIEGDVIVMSTPRYVDNAAYPTSGKVAVFEACAFRIQSLTSTSFVFANSGTWGTVDNSHCPYLPDPGKTVYFKLALRHWRIDVTRPADGVLQLAKLSATTGAPVWEDQGYGFTDLQVATRFFERNDLTDTPDPDLDPQRDWYSGNVDQENLTRPGQAIDFRPPIQVTISLVARTERDVEGIASTATPKLTVTGNENHNSISDRDSVPLPSVDPALSGNRIFRYATFQVDLRNVGVGL